MIARAMGTSLLILLVFATSAFTQPRTPGVTDTEVVLGITTPLSGPAAAWGTTGLAAMDYRLTDNHADPPGLTEAYHSEQLYRLPDTAMCYRPGDSPEVGPLPALHNGQITLGSMNTLTKMSEVVLALWARVLAAVPRARLMLLTGAGPGADQRVRQTDAEQEMLAWLHAAADEGADVVLNPGAWSHYNYAIRDACSMLRGKLIEVHISNIHAREAFRHHSVISAVAVGVIAGLGVDGYRLALGHLARFAG